MTHDYCFILIKKRKWHYRKTTKQKRAKITEKMSQLKGKLW